MTGPEHYREAERLLGPVKAGESFTLPRAADVIATAQVHATLALAAATANPFTPQSGWEQVTR